MWKILLFAAFLVIKDSFFVRGYSLRSEQVQAVNCTQVGMICSEDLSEIHICTMKGQLSKFVRDCSKEGLLCNNDPSKQTITCEKGVPPSEKNVNFECIGEGEFPDPINCRVTYRCQKNQQKPTKRCICSAQNQYILPVTGLPCVVSDKCPRKTIKCENNGDTGKFTAHDGKPFEYYYYCKEKPKFSSFRSNGKPSPEFDQEAKTCSPLKK